MARSFSPKYFLVRDLLLFLFPLIILFFFTLIGCSSSSSVKSTVSSPPIVYIDTSRIENINKHEDNVREISITENSNEIPKNHDSIVVFKEDNPAIERHAFLNRIMVFMGTPYKKSGNDSIGIDCSGFTANVYSAVTGMILPHSCRDQFAAGRPIVKDSLLFGDLVFFRIRRGTPSHVGIYVGDGLFAHASLSIGVTISILEQDYYKHRYVGARRIIE